MTTELGTQGGMHIDSDPKTGAIAASNAAAVEEALKTATKNDQPEQTQKAEVEQPEEIVDPRKAIMAKIYENRGEQFKRELDYAAAVSNGEEVNPISEEEFQKVETPIREYAETPTSKIESKKEEVSEEPKKKIVNVGGQNYELTDSEIEQLAQRTIYAENQARQNVQQPTQQQVQQHQQYQQQIVEPPREALKEIARKITYGSEEESAKALADFAGLTANMARQQAGPTPDQIVQVATAHATNQLRFERNLEVISSEYADIFESRSKALVAADKVGMLRQKYNTLGLPKSDIELYREGCKMTRDEFGAPSETARITNKNQPTAQSVTAQVSSSRIERKRAAPQPASAVNKVQAMQEQNSAPTGSAVVQAMRKSRGQPTA